MVVGEIAEPVDLLVVGGGPGGTAAALHAARHGRAVTLVDRDGADGLGGVCLRRGCIPSKALIEVADRATAAADLAMAGLQAGPTGFDMAGFQAWKQDTVDRLGRGLATTLEGAGVRLLAGSLRFTRPTQAVVEAHDGPPRFLEFQHAVVATGSRPVELPGLPRDGERILDSTDLLARTALPESLLVVGAGYIGVELGTACAKLGSRVTIVEAERRLLPAMDAPLVRPVTRRLRALGVDVLAEAQVRDLDDDAALVATAEGERRVPATAVVTAVGRRPNTDAVALEAAGVAVDAAGHVSVADDRRATATVAALGDVTAGHALAHKAAAEAPVAVDALAGHRTAFAPQAVPAVVFSDPEVASAGLTAGEASDDGVDADTTRLPLSASGRAATMGSGDAGFAEVVWERGTGAVLGVHLVGPHASELIGAGVLAIEMGATVEDLELTIHPHPTLSEQLREAAAAAGRPAPAAAGGGR